MKYVLYKQPIQYETLHIVQYLHSIGILLLPNVCIERNYPEWVSSLPSIDVGKERYIGLDACIQYFETISGVSDLLTKSQKFKEVNPEYRIHKYCNLAVVGHGGS